MRGIVYNLLTEDAALLVDIPKARWFSSGAALDLPEKPFAVIHWGERTGISRNLSARTLRVNIHDNRGDYTRIERVLDQVEDVLLPQIDVKQGASRITEIQWLMRSGELVDQDYKTNLMYLDFRVAGR
jgi:hypothetical protein